MAPIGDMLLELLAAEKLTQRQLANRIRISYSMLNELISGKKSLSSETAMRIEKEIPSFDSRKALRHQIEITYKRAFGHEGNISHRI